MIENLNGQHEIVNYTKYDRIKLYDNVETDCYPMHWHSSMEIIYPLENSYEVIINNTRYKLTPKDLLFIWPGTTHELIAPPTGRRIIFQAELSLLKDMKDMNTILSLTGDCFVSNARNHSSFHNELASKFTRLVEEYNNGQMFSETTIYSALLDMIATIGRFYMNQKLMDSTSNQQIYYQNVDKILQCCEYINAHFTENLTLDQIADMANFSKFHFSRLFKEVTSVSFYKYVSQKRISHAETLLSDPRISVTQVAIQSGFSTPIAFTRMFKLMKGCSPRDFRKIYEDI
ncbi:MAG: helix-turn-helix domain-containing protein [Blautia sp.]|nr:helix-turn-helix domain-containing protein [Blautia sp.]